MTPRDYSLALFYLSARPGKASLRPMNYFAEMVEKDVVPRLMVLRVLVRGLVKEGDWKMMERGCDVVLKRKNVSEGKGAGWDDAFWRGLKVLAKWRDGEGVLRLVGGETPRIEEKRLLDVCRFFVGRRMWKEVGVVAGWGVGCLTHEQQQQQLPVFWTVVIVLADVATKHPDDDIVAKVATRLMNSTSPESIPTFTSTSLLTLLQIVDAPFKSIPNPTISPPTLLKSLRKTDYYSPLITYFLRWCHTSTVHSLWLQMESEGKMVLRKVVAEVLNRFLSTEGDRKYEQATRVAVSYLGRIFDGAEQRKDFEREWEKAIRTVVEVYQSAG
ncbi:hypothetical protein HK097_006155, partial [Rhizophlyctis rosea]